MENNNDLPPVEENQEEELFELTPQEATNLDSGSGSLKPSVLNRKKLLIAIVCSISIVVCGGLMYNALRPSKKKAAGENNEFAYSNSNQEFLTGLRDRALNRRIQEEPPAAKEEAKEEKKEPEPKLPPVSFNRPQDNKYAPPPAAQQAPQSAPASGGQPEKTPTHFKSSLVPPMQGSLFSQGAPQTAAAGKSSSGDSSAARDNPFAQYGQSSYGQVNDYAAQNDQSGKQAFFDASSGGETGGQFIGSNSVWTGTIIPGILETAINTDLPGNVLARVTQNIYDSKTGRSLLIPQGTVLLARYNSSISYAQKRVQIVWDTLIRPDGFQVNLEGAGGVDRAGMSGQPANFHENWFEYLKAAGIITLFSYANAKMTDTAAKYASEDSAANLAASNAGFVGELGNKLASRATNIQPTLTVDNGTVINIMLNKTLYLPPVADFPATQKYSLE